MTFRSIAALLCIVPRVAAAQVSTVPMGDPVYPDLDRVIAAGLVENGFASQRPYTRREIARMLVSAQRSLPERTVTPATRRILERLSARFDPDIRALRGEDVPMTRAAVLRWRGDVLGLASPSRRIPDDFTGQVDATVNPLLNDRSGRYFGEGGNVAGEVEYERAVRPWLSVRVRPRAVAGVHAGDATAHGSLQTASASAKAWNIIAEVGRHEILLTQSMASGLLTSTSARPLDMVRFSTDAPFRVPGFSKVFGPLRGNLVVADLGPRQWFPHSVLVQYKLSGLPARRFELGAMVLSIQGGRGAPTTTVWETIKDLIPALKYLLADDTTQFSNKLAGWDYRLRIPELRGLQLYAEHAFEDMDPRRWKSTLWEDGGHVVGASLQNLAADGALSGVLELHHTGLRFYKHAFFRSGIAFNGTLLGDPLGTDANGAYLRLRWDEGRQRTLMVDAALERREGDFWRSVATAPNDADFRFERVVDNPPEWRERIVASLERDRLGRRTTLQLGVERVRTFRFIDGRSRTNFLAAVSVDAYRR